MGKAMTNYQLPIAHSSFAYLFCSCLSFQSKILGDIPDART